MDKKSITDKAIYVADAALIGSAVMGVWEPLVIRIAVENGYKKIQRRRSLKNTPDVLYVNDAADGDNGLRDSNGNVYGHLQGNEIVLLDGTKVPVEPA